MAHLICNLPLPLRLSSVSSSSSSSSSSSNCQSYFKFTACSCRASVSNPKMVMGTKFKELPFAMPPLRNLMQDLVSTLENRLNSQIVPTNLPPDVEYFQNPNGTAHGSISISHGTPSSPVLQINFILGSWLHSELPTGGALNIATLATYMNDSTNTPSLLIELIQSSPTSLVLILDLLPRKDLVINPEYLKTFYEDTDLENQRQLLYKIPEIQPYNLPSLYLRCVLSPTLTLVRIDTTGSGGETRMEEILRDNVSSSAKRLLDIWLDFCGSSSKGRDIDEEEKTYLKKRDHMFKTKSIEIDIGSSMPRLFGQETADRVLEVLKSL